MRSSLQAALVVAAALSLPGCATDGAASSWRPSFLSWGAKQQPAVADEGETFASDESGQPVQQAKSNWRYPLFSD
jgi:hypothetical protein